MKRILLTLTYLVGAGELILAIYFWVNHSKSEVRKVMALFAFATGMWVVTSAISSYAGQTPFTTFDTNLIFVFAILSLASLLHLVVIYPYPIYRFDWMHSLLFYIPVILFSIITFIPKAIYLSFTGSSSIPGVLYPGPIYNLYNAYLFLLFVASVAILIVRNKKLDGIHKRNVKILLWSILLGGLPAVIFDLIMPIFLPSHLPNALYANISTVIWLGATTYILIKK